MGNLTCAAPGCRNTVTVKTGGRPAIYCSDACRYRTRDRRRKALAKAAGTPGRRWRPPESWRPASASAVSRLAGEHQGDADGRDRVQDEEDLGSWDDDQDPDAAGNQDEEDTEPPAAGPTNADVVLALAEIVVMFLPAVLARTRGQAGAAEIVVTPDQVIGPAAGRELERRLQFPARPRGREPAVIEVDGIALAPHMPPTGRSCQGCHVRTGTTKTEDAKWRVLISGSQEFGLPPMIDVCLRCHADLQLAGRILEPPARIPPSR